MLESKLLSRRKTGQKTYPRPRPATYEAGAGIDRNASLFLSDDMAHWLEMGTEILSACVRAESTQAKEECHVLPYIGSDLCAS